VTSNAFLSLKNDLNVPSKSIKQKSVEITFFLASCMSLTEIAGSGSRSVSHRPGSIPAVTVSGCFVVCLLSLPLAPRVRVSGGPDSLASARHLDQNTTRHYLLSLAPVRHRLDQNVFALLASRTVCLTLLLIVFDRIFVSIVV
jgi:hypothetical protein